MNQRLATAVELAGLGLSDEAAAVTAAALKEYGATVVPTSIPSPTAASGDKTKGEYLAAARLEDLGLHSEAQAVLVEAIKSDPGQLPDLLNQTGFPGPELDRLVRGLKSGSTNTVGQWQAVRHWALPILRTIGEVLLALLVGGGLAYLIYGFGRSVATARRKDLTFSDFVALGDGDEVGKSLSALTRSNLARLCQDLPGPSLTFVTAFEQAFEVDPALVEVVPQGKYIGAIVSSFQRILPQRGWSVAGRHLPKGDRGVGLGLSIVDRRDRVERQVSLWEADFGVPHATLAQTDQEAEAATEALTRLTLPGAVWIAYMLIELLEKEPPLATPDWTSYAQFAVGASLQAGQRDEARRRYGEAVRLDPANIPALVNLTVLDTDEYRWDAAASHLRLLGELMPGKSAANAPFWYRMQYLKAAFILNRKTASQHPLAGATHQ